MIKIKRAYDPPAEEDGRRFLVDRLWPRGLTKDSLKLDGWLKEVAPSKPLRQWFNHEPARWEEFRRKYFEELDANVEAWKPLFDAARKGSLTLVYSAHDTEHNNAVALAEFLSKDPIASIRRRKA